MWASHNSSAANLAGIAAEDAMRAIFDEQRIHIASPSATGRIAMVVYGALTSAGFPAEQATYFAEWFATDGGDLDPVPDSTPPDWVPDPATWL